MGTASDADVINGAIADPVPFMQAPLSNSVQLLRGLCETRDDGTEVWHDLAVVREMNGSDEEFIASYTAQHPDLTVTEYMTKLLERTVVSVGSIDISTTPALSKLILADRDLLFLGVIRSTYGMTRDIRAVCSKCGALNDVTIDLDNDFSFEKPDHSLQKPRSVTSGNVTVHLRAPNAEDLTVAQKNSKTDAEFNTVLLSRCAVFNDNEEPEDRLEWARGLNVAVRKKFIQELLREADYGPNLEGVETQCASCGTSLPIMLDWVSLLLG